MKKDEYKAKEIINEVQAYVVDRFNEVKKANNLSGKELEAKAGISQNSISNILNNNTTMSFRSFVGLCYALGIQPKDACPEIPDVKTKSKYNMSEIKQLLMEIDPTLRDMAYDHLVSTLNFYRQRM